MSTPTRPAVSTAAERAYDLIAPLAARDPAADFPLLAIVAALQTGNDELRAIISDPGAAITLSPERAPRRWLPWVGLSTGVRVPPLVTTDAGDADLVAATRHEIRHAPYMRRGDEDYLRAKLAPLLADDPQLKVRRFVRPTEPGRHAHDLTVEVPIDDIRPEYVDGHAAAQNLVRNPTLTPGTGQYAARYATIARSTAMPGTGAFSLRVQTKATGPWGPVGAHALTPLEILTPGQRLHAAALAGNPGTVPVLAPLMAQTGGLWPVRFAAESVLLMPGEQRLVILDAIVPVPPDWTDAGSELGSWAEIADTFDSWDDLYAGVPNWASPTDASSRLLLGGPLDPNTGAALPGAAVLWADPHANLGSTLHPFGYGDTGGFAWTGTAHASSSTRPDTRTSPRLARKVAQNIPAGLLSHLVLNTGRATWESTARRAPTWAAVPPLTSSWQAAADAFHGIEP